MKSKTKGREITKIVLEPLSSFGYIPKKYAGESASPILQVTNLGPDTYEIRIIKVKPSKE